jgi:23S rRNA (guanosine2251-2'-O)-methyltransferase
MNYTRVWIWGWHVIEHVLKNKSREIHKVLITNAAQSKWQELLEKYKVNVDCNVTNIHELNHISRNGVHQGVACFVDQISFFELNNWINCQKEKSLLIACDHIMDPHNLGAIIRTAAALGAQGVLVTKMHSASFEGTLAKSAAGGLEIIPIILVANLSNSLNVLKKHDFMIYGLDETGNSEYTSHYRSVLVVGQEGAGLRLLTKNTCDIIIRINTREDFPTLNVSVATAIAMCDFVKRINDWK